jgi:hypothetical protein
MPIIPAIWEVEMMDSSPSLAQVKLGRPYFQIKEEMVLYFCDPSYKRGRVTVPGPVRQKCETLSKKK